MENFNNISSSVAEMTDFCKDIFNEIFKNCPDGVIYKDENLNYVSANKAFCDFFNIADISDIIGKKEFPFLSIENQKMVKDANLSVKKDLISKNYVINIKTENSDKFFNITTTPIHNNKECFGVVSIVKDITNEEFLKEKFIFKHLQLQSLLENIPLIIYMQDFNLNFITGTKNSKKFMTKGIDTIKNIQINIQDFQNEIMEDNHYVLQNNKIKKCVRKFFDNKGIPHWYNIHKVPIINYDGSTIGLLTLANNIDLEMQLQSQKEAFIATLGHDLKNPTLAQIRGLELLLKGDFGFIADEQKELLEMVLESCKYMNSMLTTMLATYRNYEGALKLNFEEFSFIDLVYECVSEIIYMAKDKDLKIDINKLLCESNINADRVQIKRVIMNLLTNAIKYAYRSTQIVLTVKQKDNNILFSFKNKSPYISEEKQKSIFSQYVTFSTNNSERGVGLGLYASKKIIEAHSGKMFLESKKNEINIFGFFIPLNVKKQNFDKEVCF